MKMRLPTGQRALIDKANKTVVTLAAIAAIIVTFSLVASKALWDQRSFQAEVIDKKKTALDQLKANKDAVDSLVNSYSVFIQQQPNAIEGNSQGNGERDGDNARIVLDSLPSQRDIPALASSIEKIINKQGLQASSIGVSGDEPGVEAIDEGEEVEDATVAEVSEIPFEFRVETSFSASQQLFEALQHSIRPIRIVEFSLEGSGGSAILATIKATTYFKPAQSLDVSTETIQ